MKLACAISCVLAVVAWPATAGDSIPFAPTAEDVVRRMVEMDKLRASALRGYVSERRYIAGNEKFAKHAEVAVRESFVPPDQKDLKIVSEAGSPVIRRKVIDKLIEAELDAVSQDNGDQTHIAPQNYTFRLTGMEEVDGSSCFVLEVIPRIAKKHLMRGQIWVDANDFAIVRMEGSPAKNPSIWTHKVRFVRRYPIFSQSTLPHDADLLERLFGEEIRAGVIQSPFDISDVWKNSFSASTNHKLWAAKFTARHPNLVALEVSSFKCGHDAPIYSVVEAIIEQSGTPYFCFKDLDENRPLSSIRLRVETIDYFLKRYREIVMARRRTEQAIEKDLADYERGLLCGASTNS
jgi:hypothetical protein